MFFTKGLSKADPPHQHRPEPDKSDNKDQKLSNELRFIAQMRFKQLS